MTDDQRAAVQQAAERLIGADLGDALWDNPFGLETDIESVARFALAATARERELVEAIQDALSAWEHRDEVSMVDTLRAALVAHRAPATDRQP